MIFSDMQWLIIFVTVVMVGVGIVKGMYYKRFMMYEEDDEKRGQYRFNRLMEVFVFSVWIIAVVLVFPRM
ncbi:hypothetical protein [Halobacillus naozhouensis]|uniref:Uncharacterized protein n=1 Tax=Halobacillus naozhouensis TaxID=554880 RepID=A0ABY8J3L2_9BACI|nr:hypothetical protein [Halobacillus naozhouensis]WFT77100.1 hypothetical protein P9989_21450 [Halobacillus naozhouensis]